MERTKQVRILKDVLEAYREVFLEKDELFRNEPDEEDILISFLEDSLEVVFLEDAKAFCFFRRKDIYTYTIEYLGVRDGFQGKGLGGRLLEIAINICTGKDILIKTIELVCPDKRITFYERHGFVFSEKVLEDTTYWNKMTRAV
jgi:GNAT superfamily N-acetyltransferase